MSILERVVWLIIFVVTFGGLGSICHFIGFHYAVIAGLSWIVTDLAVADL